MRSVSQIADELYGRDPAGFTVARDAAVSEARAGGDRATAAELAALKRPTQAAFLANLVALRRPEVIDGLIDLGVRLRQAQASGAAALLRELAADRRRLLDEAVSLSAILANTAGSATATQAQLGEVRGTFEAAMADEDASAVVRAGRLTKALVYAGFGLGLGVAVPGSTARTSNTGRTSAPTRMTGSTRTAEPGRPQLDADHRAVQADQSAADRDRGGRRADERARAERADADRARIERMEALSQRLAAAQATLDDARAAEGAADDQVQRLAAALAALREELDQAQSRQRAARAARANAERQHATARRQGEAALAGGADDHRRVT